MSKSGKQAKKDSRDEKPRPRTSRKARRDEAKHKAESASAARKKLRDSKGLSASEIIQLKRVATPSRSFKLFHSFYFFHYHKEIS